MKRRITVAGIGMGNPDTMTAEVRKAAEGADALIGAGRMLEGFSGWGKPCFAAIAPEEIRRTADAHPAFAEICVLMSGDVGLYSGAKKLKGATEASSKAAPPSAGEGGDKTRASPSRSSSRGMAGLAGASSTPWPKRLPRRPCLTPLPQSSGRRRSQLMVL